jgi:hypothetical protein
VVAIVLALPGMRRDRGTVDDAADVDHDEPGPDLPPVPVVVPATTDQLVPARAGADPTRSGRRRMMSPDQTYVGRRAAGERNAGGRRARGRLPGNGDDA